MGMGAELLEEAMINEFILEGYMRDRLRSKIWVTSGGKEIPVQLMGDTHIKNTISWLDRNYHYPFSDEWIELFKVELENRVYGK